MTRQLATLEGKNVQLKQAKGGAAMHGMSLHPRFTEFMCEAELNESWRHGGADAGAVASQEKGPGFKPTGLLTQSKHVLVKSNGDF